MSVSVIMPVYNASGFLADSIGSLLKQDFEDWELICVDDGSADDSLLKLREYEKADHRIKVYFQANAGPAQARKLGIYHSAGKYIAYLDSDDTYSTDYLSSTLNAATTHDADVVMPVLKYRRTEGEALNFNSRHNLEMGQEISPRDAFMRTFPWRVHGFCLYRAEHMKRFALTEISEVNNFNADEYLTRHLFLYASKIVVSSGIYYYGINDQSITRKFSTKKLGSLKVNDLLFKLAVKEGFGKPDLQKIANHSFNVLFSLRLQLIENKEHLSDDEIKNALNQLSQRYDWQSSQSFWEPRILRNKAVSCLPESLIKKLLNVRSTLRAG